MTVSLSELDRKIINQLQLGFPIAEQPFAVAAKTIGCSEAELIDRLKALLDEGILTRFGPMYQAEQLGGELSLAAMAVPEESFDRIAHIVNQFDAVAHNYQRDHSLNMWFVLATEHPGEQAQVIKQIEAATGLPVYNMPKQEEYYVGLYLPV